MMTANKDRLLVVGPSWVGDMVMAQSLFKLLKQKRAHTEITVLAPPWSRALLERMPEVDNSIESPFEHGDLKLLERKRFANQLRGRFDRSLVLPNSFKSALIPFFAGVPERTGWRGEFRDLLLTDCRKLDQGEYPMMVQRFLALAVEEGVELGSVIPKPCLRSDKQAAIDTAKSLGLSLERKVLALCPGAEYGDSKMWPQSHYARLSEMAIGDGWQVWLIGSPNDSPIASEIHQSLNTGDRKHCVDISGKTRLDQAIDLLSIVDGVVSNDSGLMHIAAAVERPLIALYGSTSPDFTPPLAERVKSISTDISCRPCFKRRCPFGHKRCLTEITPREVFGELNQLVAS